MNNNKHAKINYDTAILIQHEDFFEEDFLTELDSWFSADIACCDSCYDQFLAYWPLAYEANDAEFQRSSIDLDTLYAGSKILQTTYTQEEYDILKHTVHCPRCNAQLHSNIWVYNLPFDSNLDTYEFESQIEQMSVLSKTTPFLLVKNKFASNIYDLLNLVASNTINQKIHKTLFRARPSTQVEKLCYSEFTIAPKKVIQEGRYNHAGHQVLYLASDMETCFNEINRQLCYIAECEITQPIKILDLVNPDVTHNEFEEKLNALVFSALMSKKISTTGWDKPAYIFSRFVSDCAKSAGFDAIKYPSTKSIKDNYNLVIINDEVFSTSLEYKNLFFYDGKQPFNLGIPTK